MLSCFYTTFTDNHIFPEHYFKTHQTHISITTEESKELSTLTTSKHSYSKHSDWVWFTEVLWEAHPHHLVICSGLLRWRPACLLTLNYSPVMGFETSRGAVARQQRELSINGWAGSPATLNMLITRAVPSWLPQHQIRLLSPCLPGLPSHIQPVGQVRISFMRGYQEEFTFASMSRIPKQSLLKVSVLTCKIFGILVVLICIVMKTHPWTIDLAQITIKLPQE